MQASYFTCCATYCASKAFVGYLSGGIAYELRGKVDVLCHAPGAIATNLVPGLKKMNLLSPESTVKGALSSLGKDEFTTGNMLHDFQF